jgi:hypothetical protein
MTGTESNVHVRPLPLRFFVCAMVWLLASNPCTADIVPGVDWYVRNAEIIFRVKAQTPAEAEVFPPAQGEQRLIVEEVLKGIETALFWSVPSRTLNPGQRAIILVQYEHPPHWATAIQTNWRQPAKTVVWPIVGTRVLTGGIPDKSRSFGFGFGLDVSPESIAAEIKASSPEEVGLYRQVVDACLFPEKISTLARTDSQRATYVRFAVAIRNLDRDVPGIAALLESPDSALRAAAARKLASLTQAGIPAPEKDTPDVRHAWSTAWRRWWQENQRAQTWDDTRGAWVLRGKDQPWPRGWPAVRSGTPPPDTLPSDLLQAVARNNAEMFAPAFRRWLDSGVMRDRQINAAAAMRQVLVDGSNLGSAVGWVGEFLPAAPRLRPDVIFDARLQATERAQAIALISLLWHYDAFVQERRETLTHLQAVPINSEELRRAAFWEMQYEGLNTPGSLARQRLAEKK